MSPRPTDRFSRTAVHTEYRQQDFKQFPTYTGILGRAAYRAARQLENAPNAV